MLAGVSALALTATTFLATPAFAASSDQGDAGKPKNPCRSSLPVEPGFELPDLSDVTDPSPEGGWFQVYGTPGEYLCIPAADGSSVTAVRYDRDGVTAPLYFTWGPHLLWQARHGARSSEFALNLDCWDPACMP